MTIRLANKGWFLAKDEAGENKSVNCPLFLFGNTHHQGVEREYIIIVGEDKPEGGLGNSRAEVSIHLSEAQAIELHKWLAARLGEAIAG